MSKYFIGFALAFVINVSTFGQGTDWLTLLRELGSREPASVDAARKRLFEAIVPELETKDAKALDADVSSILKAFQETEAVRLQASAILNMLAATRKDGTLALRSAIPVWISQFADPNVQIRRNAVVAVINLKPDVPDAALEPLILMARDDDNQTARGAAFGLARLSTRWTAAMTAFKSLMASDQPTHIKRNAVLAIAPSGVRNEVVMAALAGILKETDRDLVLDAIQAAVQVGLAATPILDTLQQLADSHQDPAVAKAAASAASRLR